MQKAFLAFQSGDTALHLSCREGLLSTAQTLCALGCLVDVANGGGGLHPIHLAARGGHIEIVRCLALAGCKIDAKSADGVTPDLAAIANGHGGVSDLIKRLKGLDANDIRSETGQKAEAKGCKDFLAHRGIKSPAFLGCQM